MPKARSVSDPFPRCFQAPGASLASMGLWRVAKEHTMDHIRPKSILLGLATTALACATGCPSALAAPSIFVTSDYETQNGVFTQARTTRTATTGTSTSQLDAGDFAAATADATAGSVGIGMATTLS